MKMKNNNLLEVKNLKVSFRTNNGLLQAVDDVSFNIERGKTLAIVGESGCGKTTTALAVANLLKVQGGAVRLFGKDFLSMQGESLRQMRGRVQFIFQDPYASLNPRLRAGAIVGEPLISLTNMKKNEREKRIAELFSAVGLRAEHQYLFPHQFSGGQRQRIGIARALATKPDLIICDEPVSALDVAVQAQILNLLRKLQKEFGLTYLFISHDLAVVQYMCDSVAVMYRGKIVENATRLELFNRPLHPYTLSLLKAVPRMYSGGVGK